MRPGENRLSKTQSQKPLSALLLACVLAGCSREPVLFVDGGDAGQPDAGDAGDAGQPDAGDAGLRIPDAGPQFAPPIVTSVAMAWQSSRPLISMVMGNRI